MRYPCTVEAYARNLLRVSFVVDGVGEVKISFAVQVLPSSTVIPFADPPPPTRFSRMLLLADHDLHHSRFEVNYAFPFPFLDVLNGTYEGAFLGKLYSCGRSKGRHQ